MPPSLTIASLRRPHSSQPGNPLIAEPLFLAKYIEKAGTGTVDMYDQCRKAGMRPPEFRLENGFFILTIRRKKIRPLTQPIGAESGAESVMTAVMDGPLSMSEISALRGGRRPTKQSQTSRNLAQNL